MEPGGIPTAAIMPDKTGMHAALLFFKEGGIRKQAGIPVFLFSAVLLKNVLRNYFALSPLKI